jgi:hypothetical protein
MKSPSIPISTPKSQDTGAFFSCIHEMKEPNTLALVPPSVEPELLVPENPFSISSIQRTQGEMASAVWVNPSF